MPSFAWQSSTGADRVAERVNTPATVLPGTSSASITSVRFLYFTPACAAAKVTPSMTGRSGKAAGASGETAMDHFSSSDRFVRTAGSKAPGSGRVISALAFNSSIFDRMTCS